MEGNAPALFTHDFSPVDSSIHFPIKADRCNHLCIIRTTSVLGPFVVDSSLNDHPLRRMIGLCRINKATQNLCLESRTQDVDVDVWLTEANVRGDAKEPTWIRLAAHDGTVIAKMVCFILLLSSPILLTARHIAHTHLQPHPFHAACDLWIFPFHQHPSPTLIHRRSEDFRCRHVLSSNFTATSYLVRIRRSEDVLDWRQQSLPWPFPDLWLRYGLEVRFSLGWWTGEFPVCG